MKLYICEKPSQGRDIAKVLGASEKKDGFMTGNGAIVTWCLGHLLQQATPEAYCDKLKPWRRSVLPVIPDNWQCIPNPKTTKQLTVVKKLVKSATDVVIATDADREGEAIAREVLDFCHYKGNIERLWLSALDTASIKKALNAIKPGSSTEPLYQAALGRSRADWLIGMNMTMATTASFSKGEGVLSVGRVQTPTLQLVVNRDLAIENFKVSDYYVVEATFKSLNNESFITTWNVPEDEQDSQGHCIKRSVAEMVCSKIEHQTATIESFSEGKKKSPPPLCLSLSSLQKLASSQLGLGAKETLEVAQSLYETHKATTYPRTDCGYLPTSQLGEANTILNNIKQLLPKLAPMVEHCDTRFKSPTWNDKKITAHHGIIPTTNSNITIDAMSDKEVKVFELITRYYLAQFLGDYVYAQRKVTVAVGKHTFSATDNTPIEPGWKKAIVGDKETAEKSNPIPHLTQGDSVENVKADVLTKQTKPPARYTEGTLIQAMKNVAKEIEDKELKKILKDTAGIGTEATRANIIEILLKRAFLKKDKKTILSTEKGRTLLEKLPLVVKNPTTTAQWEQMLDEVANGNATLSTFMQGQAQSLHDMLERLDNIVKTQPKGDSHAEHQCPDCKSELLRRKGKKGFFWGCSRYPDCSTTLQDDNGKPVMRKPQVLSHHDCPTCKQHKLAKRQGKKSDYWACSGYPDCKAIFWDKGNSPDFDNLPKPRTQKRKA